MYNVSKDVTSFPTPKQFKWSYKIAILPQEWGMSYKSMSHTKWNKKSSSQKNYVLQTISLIFEYPAIDSHCKVMLHFSIFAEINSQKILAIVNFYFIYIIFYSFYQ